ncbi:hypothetical protein [Sphingomonas pituitosa]|uniref:hypothetical protein n=1 Tax=Sphingomonas pituitosa TaxID=99597 RepID=UPI000830E6B8|nr:hypothetical protein [Sphingomonas pituitosa]
MKGQILGVESGSGIILGEDGQRYRFTPLDWKDVQPPAAQDQVDFVALSGQATEIYRMQASPAPAWSVQGLGQGTAGGRLPSFATRPPFLLALLLLLAALFLPFIDNGSGDEKCCASLTGIYQVYSGIAAARTASDAVDRQFASLDFHRQIERQRARNNGGWSTIFFQVAPWLGYALWLIPLGAAAVMLREIKGDRSHTVEGVVGLGALATLLLIPATRSAFAAYDDGLLGFALRGAAETLGFGFGAFVVGACGAGLVFTALDAVRRPSQG